MNSSPGNRGDVEGDLQTPMHGAGIALGNAERHPLRIHGLDDDQLVGGGDVIAQTHEPLADHAGKRGSHRSARQSQLQQIQTGPAAPGGGVGALEIGGGGGVLLDQLLGARQGLFAEVAFGLGSRDLGLEFLIVDPEQGLTRARPLRLRA